MGGEANQMGLSGAQSARRDCGVEGEVLLYWMRIIPMHEQERGFRDEEKAFWRAD
jgi:hypothetical protein